MPSGGQEWEWQDRSKTSAQALAFAPKGNILAWARGDEQTIELREAKTGRLFQRLSLVTPVLCLAWSHDGGRLAAGDETGRVLVWQISGDMAAPRLIPM